MLRKAFALIVVLFASSVGSGCAITMNLHTNRFQTPEAAGKPGAGYADFFGLEGANELVVVPDSTFPNPDVTHPRFNRNARYYYMGGGIGVMDRMNIEIRNPLSDTGMLNAKYQILGDPRLSAKEGNFSLAAVGGFFYAAPSEEARSTLYGINAKTDREILSGDFALIAGYRIADTFLIYGGTAYTLHSYTGKVEQKNSAGTITNYSFTGNANQVVFNLGLEWTLSHCLLRVEQAVGIARATQTAEARASSASTGVSAGFYW